MFISGYLILIQKLCSMYSTLNEIVLQKERQYLTKKWFLDKNSTTTKTRMKHFPDLVFEPMTSGPDLRNVNLSTSLSWQLL